MSELSIIDNRGNCDIKFEELDEFHELMWIVANDESHVLIDKEQAIKIVAHLKEQFDF